jgi:hypothetical protein
LSDKSWIDKIVDDTVEAEAPERFYWWSGLAAISACVRKGLYLDRYYYKLYPNIYVLLMAGTGGRKSGPPTLAKKLVLEAACTRVISGRNTVQAIIKDMGKAYSVNGSGVMKDAAAFVTSGELASLFIADPHALTILTDLYDTHANEPEWKNSTKSAGIDTLKNPCVTLLGATNEVLFKDAVPLNAVGGGFIGRTIIVLENKRRTINSLMNEPKHDPPDEKELANYLKEISKLSGKFLISKEARVEYDKWYHQLAGIQHNDTTGSIERLGDTVLKVAMNVSLSYNLSKEIHLSHITEAIEKTTECIGGMKQITMGAGKSDLAYATSIVLRELLARPEHKATRKQLLAKYWGEFDSLTLDRIAETLVQSRAITASIIGKETLYVMSPAVAEAYGRFKKEVN